MPNVANLLLLIVFVAATARSVTFVQTLDRHNSYWHEKETAEIGSDPLAAADTLWLQGKTYPAVKKLVGEWNRLRSSDSEKFSAVGHNLASLYLAQGSLAASANCYSTLLSREEQNADARADYARDLNNIGITYYLAATTCSDQTRARKYYEIALDQLNLCIKQLSKQSAVNQQRLAHIWRNQSYVLRDMI